MKVKEIFLSEIKPYEKNPRRNDKAVDSVAKSIKEFGFKVPIVIDADNVICCGHTRYKAAQKLGLKTVPCVIADDLTPEHIKAFRLADNKVAELADWDLAMLDEEIRSITEVDMSGFGWELLDGNSVRHLSWARTEKLCNLEKHIKVRSNGDLLYCTFYEVGKTGTPIDKIKNDEKNVEPFADNLCDWLDNFIGCNLTKGNWCLITTPRRRHKEGLHFATEICRSAAKKLSLPFYANAFRAKNRNRINPEFYLEEKPKERNVILYDDIVTTGETIRTCRDLLFDAGYVVLCVVAIQNKKIWGGYKMTGRPTKDIDQNNFEKLCALQCTMKEIMAFFDVSDKTLSSWCKRTYGKSFSEIFTIKRKCGFISLRRNQFRLAEKSAAMAIFLGKNYLGQSDKDCWQRKQDEKLLELKEKKVEQEEW